MRVNRRVSSRTPDTSQVMVSGMDMFGASFRERTSLLNRSQGGLALRLLRPVDKGRWLEVNFKPDFPDVNGWVAVEVVWVSNGLDGYQSLGARVNNPSLLAQQLRRDKGQQPPLE